MEGEHAGLGRGVAGARRHGDEAGHAGDGDDVAVVLRDHVRQERLRHPEVRRQVDPHRPLQRRIALVQNQLPAPDPRVVDHHARHTDFRANPLRDRCDGGRRAYVELVEMYFWWGRGWW